MDWTNQFPKLPSSVYGRKPTMLIQPLICHSSN